MKRHNTFSAMLLGLMLAGSVSARPVSPLLPPPVIPDGLGVNIHFTDPRPGEMSELAAAGFRWVRMDFDWAAIEKTPNKYDFAAYDRLMAALEPHHIRPIFILDYRNPLYDNGLSPHTDAGRQAFARWAAASARHFAGRGVLWEMYNEPNGGFWTPRPNAEDYDKLAIAVGKAIKSAAPGEGYIGPASSTLDMPFLEAAFRAGALKYWDAVSVHPYRGDGPETAAAEFARLRSLIARYAPPGKTIPIISGEWGYSIDPPLQGKYLARQWLSNLANGIPISIWYDWHDDGTDPHNAEHHFGTVYYPYHPDRVPVYDPKPAYLTARTLTTALRGFRFSKRLSLADPNDYALLFSHGQDVRLAVWTTGAAHDVALPASPGVFHLTTAIGESEPDREADAHGLALSLSDAPQYLVPGRPNDLLRVAAAWGQAPLSTAVRAPGVAALRLSLTNPLGHSVTVKPISGGASPSKAVTLAPRQTIVLHTSTAVRQGGAPSPLSVRWSFQGQTVEQQTQVTVVNPLFVTAIAPIGNILPVQIDNPAGEAFSGPLTLHGSSLLPASIPVRLKAGELTKILFVPLSAAAPDGFQVLGQLRDGKGVSVLPVPHTEFRPAGDFGHDPTGAYAVVPDGDPNVKSALTLTATPPPPGLPGDSAGVGALRITYRFDDGWKFLRLAPQTASLRDAPGRPSALSLWVYGDGSAAQARMRFTDAIGQTFQPNGMPITWHGWQPVVFPIDATRSGHWGGDGVIHFPIHLDSLFLIDNASRKATQGEITLCSPSWVFAGSSLP